MVVKTDVYSGFPAVAAVVDDSSRAVLEDCLSLLNPVGDVPEESRLLQTLSATLESMVEQTEQREHLRLKQGPAASGAGPQLTVFHGLRAPPISIEAYLVRIAKYAKCSPACFVHSMVHMLKLVQQDASFAPTRLNVHRLLLTGVLISAKFLDDRYFNNAFYAKVGGVSTAELNRLELEMLQLLDFQLSVTPEHLVAVLLDAQSGRLVMQMSAAYSGCCGMPAAHAGSAAGLGMAAGAAGMLVYPSIQLPCWEGPGSAVHGQHVIQHQQQQLMQQLAVGVQRKRRSNSLEIMEGVECRPKLFHRASFEVVAMAQ
ncbi:cyclin-domain-containing protein [Scenedesmus sp. NREL 46B-D3]|nr:cyclin-domain-containing protein [Scenedesmus sp. NREL 46B-D3]